ncbi:MAG TPA: Mur ligase domain-containing protein, partial [Pyrinomonadaceae bacterium]|nr:Mur ligase domain-containing protein [Pyrinomonadaceae bacterium]
MTTEPITLRQIAELTGGQLTGDGNATVTDVSHDSRQAGLGTLFAAVRGELFDAHKFVPQVLDQGAVGVLSEQEAPADLVKQAAWIRVENIRRAMALAAAEVHSHPSRELQLVGITG